MKTTVMEHNEMDNEFLTAQEMIDWLKISRSTLWRWQERGLPYIRIGDRIRRYVKADVQNWMREQEVTDVEGLDKATPKTD